MARPPVVRIMDYGKYKFEQAKMARLAKKKQHVIELKEVKFRPGIDDHDFMTKTRHAREFLADGNKVKVTLMFRGRQIAHPELGRKVVVRVAQELADDRDHALGRHRHRQELRQRLAFDEIERDTELVVLDHLDDGRDVRMTEARCFVVTADSRPLPNAAALLVQPVQQQLL